MYLDLEKVLLNKTLDSVSVECALKGDLVVFLCSPVFDSVHCSQFSTHETNLSVTID